MRASPPSPSRTKIVGDASPMSRTGIVGDAVPFRAVLVLLCRGEQLCPPVPCHSEPVRTLAWESVSPCLPLRGRWQREALTEGEMPRVFLSPSRLRRQPPPRGGLTARRCRADGTSRRRPLQQTTRRPLRGAARFPSMCGTDGGGLYSPLLQAGTARGVPPEVARGLFTP